METFSSYENDSLMWHYLILIRTVLWLVRAAAVKLYGGGSASREVEEYQK